MNAHAAWHSAHADSAERRQRHAGARLLKVDQVKEDLGADLVLQVPRGCHADLRRMQATPHRYKQHAHTWSAHKAVCACSALTQQRGRPTRAGGCTSGGVPGTDTQDWA